MFKGAATVWLVLAVVKFTGFCFSQMGWNSNRELIEAAFRLELRGRYKSPDVPDISTYLNDHPECCSVGFLVTFNEVPIVNAFLNAVFLRRFYQVEIKYPVIDPTENDGDPFYEAILVMDCCGTYVPDRYGMSSSTPLAKP